jgi:hypothetical protein
MESWTHLFYLNFYNLKFSLLISFVVHIFSEYFLSAFAHFIDPNVFYCRQSVINVVDFLSLA